MPRFIFHLDALLHHREHEERQRQRELAEAQAEMARLQAELNGLDADARASADDVRQNHLTGTLDLNYLAAHRRYVFAVQRKAMALAQKMALQQRKVEEAQRNLAEAARQRKILEKLREKRRQEWVQGQAKKESAEFDDVVARLAAGEAGAAAGREGVA